MVFTLILAIISTLFYVNMTLSEIYNNKQISFTYSQKQSETNALIRFILIIFIGVFWGVTIRFW